MTVAENMALERRIVTLERESLGEPKRVCTKFRVYRRGPEPKIRDAAHALELAALDPSVELIGEFADLDVLIDARTGARIQRAANDTTFDELAEGVDVLVVWIDCYREQLEQILSSAPITATKGGTRAGKTRVLVWWLFRQWLLRGHGVDEEHEIEAVFWFIREDSGKLYKHAVLWLLRLWPDVWVGKRPTESTKNPTLHMFDGSRIDFKHAAHGGSKAGTSLRSESVEALVVDELSAVHAEENWREAKSRVAQTGGPIAVAYTPTAGHWSAKLAKQATSSGGAIKIAKLTMFMNPWWPGARMIVDLLKDAAITATQLLEKVIPAPDLFEALDEAVTDPAVRRMRFGEEQSTGLTLWREWDPETMVVRDHDRQRSAFMGLPLVTSAVVGGFFGHEARGAEAWGGKDFNINPGVTVIMQAFGDPRRPVVLVFDEVATVGPTLRNAAEVAEVFPGLPCFCDPTGAMYMHPARGAPSTLANATDREEMVRAGLPCEPAAGRSGNATRHLPRPDSVNVMHRAMREGLLFVHARCTGVLRAMDEMEADDRGLPRKTSGVRSISDQISGYGDALRYGVWRAFEGLLVGGASLYNEAAS